MALVPLTKDVRRSMKDRHLSAKYRFQGTGKRIGRVRRGNGIASPSLHYWDEYQPDSHCRRLRSGVLMRKFIGASVAVFAFGISGTAQAPDDERAQKVLAD